MSFKIQFWGATGTVTGSNFLVTAGDTKFLVDCGMYQGPEVEYLNLEDFPYDPAEIDFLLLTHAHIDHSGLIPKLVKAGFRGLIYSTLHTAQITEVLMLDSAKIQESNYSQGIPWKFAGEVALLYTTTDAEMARGLFSVVDFDTEFTPAETELKIKYVRAGHVLGAASIEIEYKGKKVVFSGDIGRKHQDLIAGFTHDYESDVDYVVMESLYGGRQHPPRQESVDQLIDIINQTAGNGGVVYIPSFAVQRTQEIIDDLRKAFEKNALNPQVQIWLDSPMAQRVTQFYVAALDEEVSHFNFDNLHYVKHYLQSQRISKRKGNVIIAGSGMADGGRILGHIVGGAKNKRNAIVFVGYQAEGTIGRLIVDGQRQVNIDGTMVNIKAKVHHLHGFSAHGDQDDYLFWLNRYNSSRLKRTFLVHAESEYAVAFKTELEKLQIDHPHIPSRGEEVEL